VFAGLGTSASLILTSSTVRERIGFSSSDDFLAEMQNIYFPCSEDMLSSNLESNEGIERCLQSQASGPFDLILFGDNHSEQLFTVISDLNPTLNVVYVLKTPPYLNEDLYPAYRPAHPLPTCF